ncbi:hypothetical protein Bpfe_023706 [Biomphalaria pfeifferi]|uniref:Uncharacterized protein n=1 Tax=Biomphalaria pfeifferi TaxID=112525 RepID=A0AAD8B3Q8_BIOPF|nr:hypothetical protein Bpfe_023706 [Biomphalaria pfeifferi]
MSGQANAGGRMLRPAAIDTQFATSQSISSGQFSKRGATKSVFLFVLALVITWSVNIPICFPPNPLLSTDPSTLGGNESSFPEFYDTIECPVGHHFDPLRVLGEELEMSIKFAVSDEQTLNLEVRNSSFLKATFGLF